MTDTKLPFRLIMDTMNIESCRVTGGPATFQHEMNTILAPYLRKFVVVFIDDILIYSLDYADHIAHIKQVFGTLDQHHFKVKLSKCAFA